jgi:hypothetical protein
MSLFRQTGSYFEGMLKRCMRTESGACGPFGPRTLDSTAGSSPP